jgi:hypothetical protein
LGEKGLQAATLFQLGVKGAGFGSQWQVVDFFLDADKCVDVIFNAV